MTQDIHDTARPGAGGGSETRAGSGQPDAVGADPVGAETAQLELLRRVRQHARLEGNKVELPRDVMAEVLTLAFGEVIDETWYLERYADVGEAVQTGGVASGADHYTLSGIYEGRMPYRVPLDSAGYLDAHKDVLESVREGAFRSALDHFVRVGFGEGRTFRLASREVGKP